MAERVITLHCSSRSSPAVAAGASSAPPTAAAGAGEESESELKLDARVSMAVLQLHSPFLAEVVQETSSSTDAEPAVLHLTCDSRAVARAVHGFWTRAARLLDNVPDVNENATKRKRKLTDHELLLEWPWCDDLPDTERPLLLRTFDCYQMVTALRVSRQCVMNALRVRAAGHGSIKETARTYGYETVVIEWFLDDFDSMKARKSLYPKGSRETRALAEQLNSQQYFGVFMRADDYGGKFYMAYVVCRTDYFPQLQCSRLRQCFTDVVKLYTPAMACRIGASRSEHWPAPEDAGPTWVVLCVPDGKSVCTNVKVAFNPLRLDLVYEDDPTVDDVCPEGDVIGAGDRIAKWLKSKDLCDIAFTGDQGDAALVVGDAGQVIFARDDYCLRVARKEVISIDSRWTFGLRSE